MKNNSLLMISLTGILILLGGYYIENNILRNKDEVLKKDISILQTNKDSISIEITKDYKLEIYQGDRIMGQIDYFKNIQTELKKEQIYAQILYTQKYIIINIETGYNADIFEDIYLSKTVPIYILKKVRTTISKDRDIKMEICEDNNKEKLKNSTIYTPIKKNQDCITKIKK